MKLNTRTFRYLSPEDWRVLAAVEIGSKNHLVVPTTLINQLSGLRTGSNGAQKSISTLAKADLIARVRNTRYDGYRLTYGGLDYLALHAHTKSSSILHLGSQMGVGKESDIYLVTSPVPARSQTESATSHLTPSTTPVTASPSANTSNGAQRPVQSILKIHRLGRTSFRSLARNRDYHRHRNHCSWQYLSRLSAQKEYAAMCALYEAGFPVPTPIACNRHTIVMSLVPGVPLKDVPLSAFSTESVEEEAQSEEVGTEGGPKDSTLTASESSQPPEQSEEDLQSDPSSQSSIEALYEACIELSLHLASHGLIHGDLNEFNILIENVPDPAEPDDDAIVAPTASPAGENEQGRKPMKPHLIDFPQITSLSHPDAADYFARDVTGIKAFFEKRYHFVSDDPGPTFAEAQSRLEEAVKEGMSKRLDVAIEAAGFSRKVSKELERYFAQERVNGGEDAQLDGIDDSELEYESFATDNVDSWEVAAPEDLDVKGDERQQMDKVVDERATTGSADTTNIEPKLGLSNVDPARDVPETAYIEADPIVASKMASLSLRERQTGPPRAKAAAGWAI